jgi:hypothetical protein
LDWDGDDVAALQYSPLDHGKRQIRLLRLLEQSPTCEALICELKVFSLDESPQYTALSYCWGSEKASEDGFINRQIISVRPNLHSYLILRYIEQEYGWIFIDALCINQDDKTERQQQVLLMGDVYRTATRVVGWLGKWDDDLIGEEQKALCNHLAGFGWLVLGGRHRDQIQSTLMMSDGDKVDLLDDQDAPTCRNIVNVALAYLDSDDILRAIFCPTSPVYNFLCFFLWVLAIQPWWSRVWVIQEVLLARSLVLRYGSLTLDWRALLVYLEFVMSCRQRSPWNDAAFRAASHPETVPLARAFVRPQTSRDPADALPALSDIITVLGARLHDREKARAHSFSFKEAFHRFSGHNCGVLRDKVFGLMGLTRTGIPVEYGMPVAELYIRTLIQGFSVAGLRACIRASPGSQMVYRNSRIGFLFAAQRNLGWELGPMACIFLTQQVLACFGGGFGLEKVAYSYIKATGDFELLYGGKAPPTRWKICSHRCRHYADLVKAGCLAFGLRVYALIDLRLKCGTEDSWMVMRCSQRAEHINEVFQQSRSTADWVLDLETLGKSLPMISKVSLQRRWDLVARLLEATLASGSGLLVAQACTHLEQEAQQLIECLVPPPDLLESLSKILEILTVILKIPDPGMLHAEHLARWEEYRDVLKTHVESLRQQESVKQVWQGGQELTRRSSEVALEALHKEKPQILQGCIRRNSTGLCASTILQNSNATTGWSILHRV